MENIKEFAAVLQEMLGRQFGNGFHVNVCESDRNNGVKRTGITIRENGFNIAPNIYLEDYFKEYQSGKTLEAICRAVAETYGKSRVQRNFEISQIAEFDAVKGKICFKLVNTEKNHEMLGKVPCRRFLDLSVIYYILYYRGSNDMTTTIINNSMMEMWKVDEEKLHECAVKNTPKLLKGRVFPMTDLFLEDVGKKAIDCGSCNMSVSEEEVMHIASNEARLNGAAVILYDDVLQSFAEKTGGDFFALPSSIHEFLFFPASKLKADGEKLAQMVNDINQTTLQPDEVLSDHAYRYFAETGRLEIAG